MTAEASIDDGTAAALEVNTPAIVAEVAEAFSRYEDALAAGDLSEMAATFSDRPEVLRFGITDQQRGPEELARWRAAQPALPTGRTLRETTVTTYGPNFAVVTTLFEYPGRPVLGRQSQTWLRGPAGWTIVHAHVSEIPA